MWFLQKRLADPEGVGAHLELLCEHGDPTPQQRTQAVAELRAVRERTGWTHGLGRVQVAYVELDDNQHGRFLVAQRLRVPLLGTYLTRKPPVVALDPVMCGADLERVLRHEWAHALMADMHVVSALEEGYAQWAEGPRPEWLTMPVSPSWLVHEIQENAFRQPMWKLEYNLSALPFHLEESTGGIEGVNVLRDRLFARRWSVKEWRRLLEDTVAQLPTSVFTPAPSPSALAEFIGSSEEWARHELATTGYTPESE